MKRFYLIGWVFVALMVLVALSARADDYVDDVYYTTEAALTEQLQAGTLTPYFNKKQMKEVIFTEPVDSIPSAPLDTVR